MIVHSVTGGGLNRAAGGPGSLAHWVCLARRGMLHSETEAVDHLRLAPGARLDGRGRDGIAEVWFLLSGTGSLDGGREVRAGELIARPPGAPDGLLAVTGLELLTISVLPDRAVARLPRRAPELLPDEREEPTR